MSSATCDVFPLPAPVLNTAVEDFGFLPSCSSLERESFTLQKLNSTEECCSSDIDGLWDAGPWSPTMSACDSPSDNVYMDYLFSQGIADTLVNEENDPPYTPPAQNCYAPTQEGCSQELLLTATMDSLTSESSDDSSESSNSDLVILGVDLSHLDALPGPQQLNSTASMMHNYSRHSRPVTGQWKEQQQQTTWNGKMVDRGQLRNGKLIRIGQLNRKQMVR